LKDRCPNKIIAREENSKMDYLDNHSFNDHVNSTIPDSRFDSTVNDILRDKASGWNFNYYSDKNTSWDSDLAHTNDTINRLKQTIKTNETLLDKCKHQLACNRLEPKDKNYAKLSAKQQQDLNQVYAQTIDDLTIYKNELNELLPVQSMQKWNRYVDQMSNANLRKLRNKYQIDSDLEFLKRGVTWILTYTYKLMDIELPPEPRPLTCGW